MRSSSIHDDRAGLAYQPSLDGLRAIAVLAVMAFHANLPFARGGFIGVDIFFVLSGYLITTLLVREQARSGTIALGRFYMRRTLRLLPALLALVVVLHVWSFWWILPGPVWQLRRETVATLLYMANWAEIAGILSPLGCFSHAWSLAIEEQFYIVWPLVLRAMLGTFSRTVVLGVVAAMAAASALLRAVLLQGPETFSRVFHGSDTRAETILVGCFLALLLQTPSALVPARWSGVTRGLAGVAVLVLAVLAVFASTTSEWMLRSGFSITALAAALVVLELQVSPQGLLARSLAWKPLASVGMISYGLYLWHWPVFLTAFLMFPPVSPADPSFTETAVRFAATFVMASVSWFLVERPFLRWKRSWS